MVKMVRERKVPMPEQPPEQRIRNFREVPLGYTPEQAMEEAERCLQCKDPPCMKGCPVSVKIPKFISLIRKGDFEGAIAVVREDNSLPAICGRVCPYENQCEGACILGRKYEPVGIGFLERFVADYEREKLGLRAEQASSTGKRVAVVGSGPAGLTAAADLAKLGHEVTIFEALHEPGGVLMYGIPEFRLPKQIVRAEVDYVQRLGVKILTDVVVGLTVTVQELLEEFDAVFVGTGAGLPKFMHIPGESLNGIFSANEFLTRVNLMKAYLFPEYDTPIAVGKRTAVIGGGNVAMDAARTALRLGVERSMVVYRRTEREMPARVEEIKRAKEEGVEIHELIAPVEYRGDGSGWVRKMRCIRFRLGEPDSSGRPRPVPIQGSEFDFEVDSVVVAIGQDPNPLLPQKTPGLKVSEYGTIVVDEEGRTSMERVWAGGDIVHGDATVILAMGTARRAAASIHRFLSVQ
ncbi:MAG: NADPH-dependent glutamate synthase [Candidatus Hadarchaeales archaeon]